MYPCYIFSLCAAPHARPFLIPDPRPEPGAGGTVEPTAMKMLVAGLGSRLGTISMDAGSRERASSDPVAPIHWTLDTALLRWHACRCVATGATQGTQRRAARTYERGQGGREAGVGRGSAEGQWSWPSGVGTWGTDVGQSLCPVRLQPAHPSEVLQIDIVLLLS